MDYDYNQYVWLTVGKAIELGFVHAKLQGEG